MINQRKKNGKRHGPWEFYHNNGQLWRKGEYKEGWQHGIWEYYLSNGKLTYKGELKQGTKIGLCYEKKYN